MTGWRWLAGLVCGVTACHLGNGTLNPAAATAEASAPQAALDARSFPDRGPTGPGATIEFGVSDGAAPATLPSMSNGTLVRTALIMVHELSIGGDNGSVKTEGSRPIDLGSSAGGEIIGLPDPRPGLYSRVVVQLEPPDDGPKPSALGGERLSARITGQLPCGAAFVIRDAAEIRIDLAASPPHDLQPSQRLQGSVRFDVAQWFSGVTFPASDPVEIDAVHNPDLLVRFRSNLAQSAHLAFE